MKRNLWSSWKEYLNVSSTDMEEFSEKSVPQTGCSAMKLPSKDMNLFGYCPLYDDFYVVICQICGKSLKPQSLKMHLELRHKLNMHKLSVHQPVLKSPFITFLPGKNLKNMEDNIYTVKNYKISPLPGTKDKSKAERNKKHTVYVQPYPRPNSLNTCHEKTSGKLNSYRPPSDMVRSVLARSISSVKHETSKTNLCIKKLSSEPSSSKCDSQTSMTVFLRHSFVMPKIKLCDIKDQHNNHIQCLNSKALPKTHCLSEARIITPILKVLPEKKCRQSIRSPRQGSQVYHQDKKVTDWNSLQNKTNLSMNGISYSSWDQHSASFCPLSHNIALNKNGQVNSHALNCSNLTKKFGDLESQVLIRNVTMGT